ALWTGILGTEMLNRGRLSRIYYRGRFFAYPIQAVNALWNLGPLEATWCLASYAHARLRPIKNPKTLEQWVRNQFGWRLFNIFFKTYTEKVWGISTRELSADWAAQRIKSLDLWVVIRSALLPRRRPRKRGEIVTTLIDKFRYPRLGPGQVWERVAEITASQGHPVVLGQAVAAVRHQEGSVTAVVTTDSAGGTHTYTGTHFVSSIPIRELVAKLDPPAPEKVRNAANRLGYRDFISIALMIDRADVAVVREYIAAALPNLHLAGRNGMHKYNNQDHSMMTALLVARQIASGSLLDPWKVNADAVYHEDIRVGERDLAGRQVPEPVPAKA